MTTLVLADDHVAFAEALATVLVDHGLDVRALAHTTDDLVAAAGRCAPDLCLLDRWFDGGDAFTVLPELRAAAPGARFVVLTADPDRGAPDLAMTRGVHGFVHKTRGVAALLDALGRVAAGGVVVETPPRWSLPHTPAVEHGHPGHLTSRERQCLALLVEGASTPQMAASLEVGTATVRTHVQALLTKLGVHTRLEAAAHAVRFGLVAEPTVSTECRA